MPAKNKPVHVRVVDSRLHPHDWLWRQLFDECEEEIVCNCVLLFPYKQDTHYSSGILTFSP